MSSQRQVSVRDLVEEGKKRIVILIICVVGLSYLMSLTSSSVWVNLPAAASLIILLRYFSLDYEMRRKAATYNNKASSTNPVSQNNTSENSMVVEKSDWKRKVSSPVVEDAIDHFTRHLVSEFVTDLWYSRLTPDQQVPGELVQIVNGVLGEISCRLRNINIIDLLMRDVINLICTHLELFRATQAKIEKNLPGLLSIEQRDKELQHVLAAENRLHPALFSAESEHKVLQHLMDGLISFTFRPEDLKCSVFRYIVRELLACAVMRPVLNLASPRFINERIEIFVISKANKGAATAQEACQSKPNGSSKISCDQFTRILDPTATGVELVQLKADQSKAVSAKSDNANITNFSKDPLLSIDTRSSRSWSSLPLNSKSKDEGEVQNHHSGEFGEMLDMLSRRKTAALAPENFDNMWAKGRNYQHKGQNWPVEQVSQSSSVNKPVTVDHLKTTKPMEKHVVNKLDNVLQRNGQTSRFQKSTIENPCHQKDHNSTNYSFTSYDEDDEHDLMHVDDGESGSASPYTSEEEDVEEDPNSVTGLDDPGTKVWDRKTNRNPVSPIRHPLENRGRHGTKKTSRSQARYERSAGTQSGRKRSRTSAQKGLVWQEIERTSFLSGDGQDILSLKGHAKPDVSSEDSEAESVDRVYSGATACSSALSVSIPKSYSSTPLKNSLMVDSFFKLRCEVLGANIVKSASRTFAVYSISVTDVNNNSWSIKRRFRHFEELHRRLKEYPEYNLHLPPKHFLSTGLDMPVIQERCKLLDRYLKELLQLPRISGSIEVWDFLSVDSQTYVFSNSFSIIETLSVDLDDKPSEKGRVVSNFVGPANSLSAKTEKSDTEHKKSTLRRRHYNGADGVTMNPKSISHSPKLDMESGKSFEDSGSDSDTPRNKSSVTNVAKNVKGSHVDHSKKAAESLNDPSTDATLPTEWVPPNLTAPILDLVDVIFQLQDGGWIRRKAFWVAKQILQLGMGDAVDDWLIEKIQLLRTGSVVASGIKRVEQILWPDGIFITKHPKRRQSSVNNSLHSSPHGQQSVYMSSPKASSPLGRQPAEVSSPRLSDEQRQEADRRAKFVYELMIDNAPAAIASVVGRKEYEQCAKDLYFFLQSSVCLKQLAYDLLELLLLSAFPEMDYVFRQLHEEKHRFGEFKLS